MKPKSNHQIKLESLGVKKSSFFYSKKTQLVLIFSIGFFANVCAKEFNMADEKKPIFPKLNATISNTDSKPSLAFLKQVESFEEISIPETNMHVEISDKTTIRNKINKTFSPGYYNIVVEGKDGYRLSLDGGLTFAISNLKNQEYAVTSQIFYLSGKTNLVLEYYEQGGQSQVSFKYIGKKPISQTKEIEKNSQFVMEQEQF
jgi:hypothetical protein